MTLTVALCKWEAAKYSVTHWHYSGVMPSGRAVTIGAWETDSFIGTVVFSRGASKALMRPYGLDTTQGCELTRVALREHQHHTSEVVSRALRILRETNTGLRLVLSFADPYHGHHGGIYQAGNWLYLGHTPPATYFRDSVGRLWHPRQATSTGYGYEFGQRKRCAKRDHCTPVKMPGKHRYAMPLDKSIRRMIQKRSLPYPQGG